MKELDVFAGLTLSLAGKSAGDCERELAAYGRRLKDLHGRWSWVPPAAFGIKFEGDFLADRRRALGLLRFLRKSPFFTLELRTEIPSFFRTPKGVPSRSVDDELIAALRGEVFASKARGPKDPGAGRPHLLIGTGSFCDRELGRMRRTYDSDRVSRAARALSERGISQSHLFIPAGAETTVPDLLESLSSIVRLKALCGGSFAVRVSPATTTPSDPSVRTCVQRLTSAQTVDWLEEFELFLVKTLLESENLSLSGRDPRRAKTLKAAVERFHRYQELEAV